MNLSDSIDFIDFHTHHGCGTSKSVAIVNIMAGNSVPDKFPGNTLFSAGIHPWYTTDDNADSLRSELILTLAHPHVVAIGEAGFDMLRGPSEKVQRDIFRYQAELAEELQRPLILHCVRAYDKLISEKKIIKPSVPWIIHGFRGKSSLAQSLADEGFWLSLGKNGIEKEIISATGTERLFLETDDAGGEIGDVYSQFSEVSGISVKELIKIFRDNFNRCLSQ